MLTIKEASERYNLSRYFVRAACLAGDVYAIKSGSKFLINEDSLYQLLTGPQPQGLQQGLDLAEDEDAEDER
jgi:excisionase family DNA binding protein